MTTVATRYGLMRIIDHDYFVSKSLALYGEWAQAELELLGRFITPGSCVLDAGAFIGTHTLAFAMMAGPTGKVYAFEPRREIFDYLQANIAANGLTQAQAHNVALGRQPDELAMDRLDLEHDENFGGLSLLQPHRDTASQYSVSVITLDGMALPPVDVIKLDVEGMESDVLAGAVATIARDRPVIFAECNSLESGALLMKFAGSNGYRIFGSVSAAYNPANFNSEIENIFDLAKELGLLLLASERFETYKQTLGEFRLPEIETLDDLVSLLLSKPQYYDEVLAPFCTAHELHLLMPTAALAEAQAATGRCEAALTEVKALAFARLDEITALTTRVDKESEALQEAQRLAFARMDEITALREQLDASPHGEQKRRAKLKSAQTELAEAKTAAARYEAALHEAKSLALSRLDEIIALTDRASAAHTAQREAQTLREQLASTRQSLEIAHAATGRCEDILTEAQRLAFERLNENTALQAQLDVTRATLKECQAALTDANATSLARANPIAMPARADRTAETLTDAQCVAPEQLDEIVALRAQVAIAVGHAEIFKAQLANAQSMLETLTQTKVVKTLGRIGLLKMPQ